MGFVRKLLQKLKPILFVLFLFYLKIRKRKKILILWNRGLGDIPLGLYGLNKRIKQIIPDAEITYLTRSDLLQGFQLLEDCKVIVDDRMVRGKSYEISYFIKRQYEFVFTHPDPTYWLLDQLKTLTPKLKLSSVNPNLKKNKIAIHVQTETGEFYGYDKNWPIEHFQELIQRLNFIGKKPILIGLKKDNHFLNLDVEDLRGEKSILDVLNMIINECRVLIAPDSGILSMVYYIDHQVPLKVISLWADKNQGILKQGVESPNRSLNHIYFYNQDLSKVSVESLFSVLFDYAELALNQAENTINKILKKSDMQRKNESLESELVAHD